MFLNYRKQFEMSQQVRIQSKMQQTEDERKDDDTEDELGRKLGIPFLKFDLMDPR